MLVIPAYPSRPSGRQSRPTAPGRDSPPRSAPGRAPPQALAYRGELERRGGLGLVDVPPTLPELPIGGPLRHPGAIEHAGAPRAAVGPAVAAAAATPRLGARMRTRGRQCHRVGRALAVAGAQRGHEPVPPHLVGHGRGRPVDLAGYLPAPLPLVQHPLYGLPLVPREPRVRPLRRPSGPRSFGMCPSVPRAGISGPRGATLPRTRRYDTRLAESLRYHDELTNLFDAHSQHMITAPTVATPVKLID